MCKRSGRQVPATRVQPARNAQVLAGACKLPVSEVACQILEPARELPVPGAAHSSLAPRRHPGGTPYATRSSLGLRTCFSRPAGTPYATRRRHAQLARTCAHLRIDESQQSASNRQLALWDAHPAGNFGAPDRHLLEPSSIEPATRTRKVQLTGSPQEGGVQEGGSIGRGCAGRGHLRGTPHAPSSTPHATNRQDEHLSSTPLAPHTQVMCRRGTLLAPRRHPGSTPCASSMQYAQLGSTPVAPGVQSIRKRGNQCATVRTTCACNMSLMCNSYAEHARCVQCIGS